MSAAPSDRLRDLRRRFAEKLPSRLDQLRGIWMRHLEGDPEALTQLLQAAHQLKGTAGTYGYDMLAERLRGLEALLRQPGLECIALEIDALTETQWQPRESI